jgi:hypothetical protein
MRDEVRMEKLYNAWCVAEFEADCIYDELQEDFTHPRVIAAVERSRELLFKFLHERTVSLRHIFLKLQVACDTEDFMADVRNPACRDITPHAVVGALQDLQAMA